MAQVNVTISGRTYRMACDDGQEPHLARLADNLNESIQYLREQFGEIGDLRLTVMAAITLADQHADALRRLRLAEAELAALRGAGGIAPEQESGVVEQIAALAERLEGLVGRVTISEAVGE